AAALGRRRARRGRTPRRTRPAPAAPGASTPPASAGSVPSRAAGGGRRAPARRAALRRRRRRPAPARRARTDRGARGPCRDATRFGDGPCTGNRAATVPPMTPDPDGPGRAAAWRCAACGFELARPIARLRASTVALYDDARFPGRCVLALDEHATLLEDLPL